MGPGRVELPTLPLSGVRSSQLSYGPATPPETLPASDRIITGPSKLNSSARSEAKLVEYCKHGACRSRYRIDLVVVPSTEASGSNSLERR